jgi:hypothetical protein
MYANQNLETKPIRLFQLPNTLAGDAGVTIIIQSIITWLIEMILVRHDVITGSVQPIGFITEPTNLYLRWLFMLDGSERIAPLFDGQSESPSNNASSFGTVSSSASSLQRKPRRAPWFLFLFNQVLRGFIVAFISFIFFWGPAVGIMTAHGTRSGGDWVYPQKWSPEVFKLVLGGLLGLVTTPPMAMFWLVRAGWKSPHGIPATDSATAPTAAPPVDSAASIAGAGTIAVDAAPLVPTSSPSPHLALAPATATTNIV